MKKSLFLLPLLFTPMAYADDFNTYALLESFSYSEAIAIKALATNQWNAKLYNGDVAFTTDRIEIGAGWKQWKIGVFRRYDYFYEFTPDTALLKYSAENNQDLTPGKQLDIYLSANTLIANGLSLAFTHTVDNANFSVKASYLNAKNLTYGYFSGNAEVVSEKDYDLNFYVDYYYSEDKLFDRVVEAPGGDGFAIDINVDWQIKQWGFNLNIKDLFSRIYWRDNPRTIATGDTDTKRFDENGFLIFDPVISGLEINQNFIQVLPKKIHFTTSYAWNDYSMLLDVQDFEIKRFYSIGAGINKNSNERMAFFYNFTAQALKFSYQNQWLSFSLMSDETQLQKARTFALGLSVVYVY